LKNLGVGLDKLVFFQPLFNKVQQPPQNNPENKKSGNRNDDLIDYKKKGRIRRQQGN
jgi:hypothetical protein